MKELRSEHRTARAVITALVAFALFLSVPVAGYADDLQSSSETSVSDTSGSKVQLTEEEQRYLAEHPDITIAMDTSWTPYAYSNEDGSTGGIIRSILDEVADSVGLSVTYVNFPRYIDALTAVRSGETMMVSGLANDPEMAQKNDLNITDPYINITYCSITQNGRAINDLYAQDAQYNVAVCKGSYATDAMKLRMPRYNFIEYSNNKDCIEAAKSGEVDLALVATYSANFYMQRPEYKTLTSVLIDDYTWKLSFGVNPSIDPVLISILNKGIATLGTDDINQAIFTALTEAESDAETPLDLIYDNPFESIVIGAVIIAIITLIVGLSLHRRQKTRNELRRMQLEVDLAERENKAKTDFLSQVSHELRTPLNAIVGMAYLGTNNTSADPTSLEYFRTITDSSEYLQGIINDVLEARRIEAGKVTLEEDWCDPESLFANCEKMMSAQFREKGVSLTRDKALLDGRRIEAKLDGLRYRQVIMNLLSNALKFTPEGGHVCIRVAIKRIDETRIALSLAVSDDGIGMSEEFQKQLFTPFTQEGSDPQSVIKGTGLGLSIVKGIVNLAHADITVESAVGKGTTFTITDENEFRFSASASEDHVEAPNPAADDDAIQGMKVLLAEDNDINAKIAVSLLEKQGCIVTRVEDGIEAVAAIQNSPEGFFDAVLMDIRMPNMGGYEATTAIRHLDRNDVAALPIIAMTANALVEDMEESEEHGLDGHLSKPVDPDTLFKTLAEFRPVH